MLTFLSRSNAAVISAITVTCLLTVALSGCTKRRAKAPTDPGETPGKVEQKVAGSLLFEQHCAQCHGALGQGKGDAPALVGEAAR